MCDEEPHSSSERSQRGGGILVTSRLPRRRRAALLLLLACCSGYVFVLPSQRPANRRRLFATVAHVATLIICFWTGTGLAHNRSIQRRTFKDILQRATCNHYPAASGAGDIPRSPSAHLIRLNLFTRVAATGMLKAATW